MAGKIIIDTERCKGCGLCIAVCPKNNIHVSEQSNKNGYFFAECDGNCTGCAMCAIMCPEAVIEVFVENNISQIKGRDGKAKKAVSKSK
ncbi:MAG: ferredoxin family protein [Phycisphaerae bacterium]|jgi:2-oxoglutarate ferredoxin oxidoreductase subunit delta